MTMQRPDLHSATVEGQPSPEQIRAELGRILDSSEFKATPQRRQMLTFLVEEMLAGRGRNLKGYTIGVAVFGRAEDFDPQADPIVRLEARRLRRDLDSYYVSEGRNNRLRITVPKGHYVPVISLNEAEKQAQDQTSAAPAESPASLDRSAEKATGKTAGSTARKPGRLLTGAVLAGLAIIAVIAGLLLDRRFGQTDAPAFVADGPALIVMPFEVFNDNAENATLAAGLTDQIMTELSRFSYFRLYLPSAGTTQSRTTDLAEQGRRLGLDYIVTGSVGTDASAVRVNARLIDVPTGRVVWAAGFDRARTAGSLLAIEGEIAAGIASALGQPYGVIRTEITSRLSDDFSPSMPSYECVLRGYSYRRSFARELHAPVLACLEKAVRNDPEYAEAWAMLGWMYLDAGRFGDNEGRDTELLYDRALGAAYRAIQLDGNNVLALKALSSINHYMGNFEEGERFARQALELNPNDPDTLAQLGWRLAVRGNFDEGIPFIRQAIDRTVNPPGWYHQLIAIDHYMNGRYPEMLAAAKSGVVDGTGVNWSLVAIAHGALGNKAAAHEALEKMADVSPAFARDPAAVYRMHGVIDDISDALVSGMRKAGWTEPQSS